MDLSKIHSIQLALMHRLHEWRSPAVDSFFRSMVFFDTFFFALLVLALVWYGISWRWGLSLAILLVISDTSNYLLKELFAQPRPAYLDPTLALSTFSHYSFPSGGAQQAAVLFGSIATWASNAWKGYRGKQIAIWCACCLAIFCISFTRVFLGAHFPTDVMASWVTAALLIALFTFFARPFANWFEGRSSIGKAVAVVLFSALPFLFIPTFSYAVISILLLGVLCGFLYARKTSLLWEPQTSVQRVISCLFIVASLLVIQYGILPYAKYAIGSKAAKLLIQFATALWISCGAMACLQWIFSSKQKTQIP